MCIDTPADELKLLTDVREQKVLSVEELVIAPSPRYPGVPAGSVVDSETYLPSAKR
jgi:hypothetical protein